MDEKEIMLIVLKAIKLSCRNNENCAGCPFNLVDFYGEHCMFAGDNFDEGVNPEEWDLEELEKEIKDNGR